MERPYEINTRLPEFVGSDFSWSSPIDHEKRLDWTSREAGSFFLYYARRPCLKNLGTFFSKK